MALHSLNVFLCRSNLLTHPYSPELCSQLDDSLALDRLTCRESMVSG